MLPASRKARQTAGGPRGPPGIYRLAVGRDRERRAY